ncbi:MAG: hypothetical protein WBD47_13340 [Phormidesmis sp.]
MKHKAPLSDSHHHLSIVRPHLSATPRTTRADFKVRSTRHALEIQFSPHRIRAHILTASSAERWLFVLFVVLSTTVFVGGPVAYTGSVLLGVMIALLLPLVFKRVEPDEWAESSSKAVLRLNHDASGGTLVSLMTRNVSSNTSERTEGTEETILHFSRLALRSLSITPTLLDRQLCFTLAPTSDRPDRRLRIAGSRRDIRWLCAHIAQWDAAIERPAASDISQ